jgi:predicted metal-dependent enzyme (double-stranded beta helix superfamily)
VEPGQLTFNPIPNGRRFSRDRRRPELTLVPAEPASLLQWQRQRSLGRELSRRELEQLVDDLARRPELWRGLVRHSDSERFYVQLALDDHIDVWLICWCRSQDTGFHDHDRSRGAVAVVEGSLRETLLGTGGEHPIRNHDAGGRFSFGATHIHDVQGAGRGPATSLHAYSPPLGEMGFYEIRPDGTLTRRVGDYREELC